MLKDHIWKAKLTYLLTDSCVSSCLNTNWLCKLTSDQPRLCTGAMLVFNFSIYYACYIPRLIKKGRNSK
jgi:hypothetical protein